MDGTSANNTAAKIIENRYDRHVQKSKGSVRLAHESEDHSDFSISGESVHYFVSSVLIFINLPNFSVLSVFSTVRT